MPSREPLRGVDSRDFGHRLIRLSIPCELFPGAKIFSARIFSISLLDCRDRDCAQVDEVALTVPAT
ncbi:hypothetical protein ACFQYP_56355 [Nonomuraea antimicrobica]